MTGRQNKKNKIVKLISITMSVFMTLSPMVAYAEETEDTASLVEKEINSIENEAVKEAVEEIVNVDMSDVDNALDRVTEIVNETITDEVVANEVEATADALISIYDEQAAAALDILTEVSKNSDTVTVSEDGSVSVDWEAATAEVNELNTKYQEALKAEETAQAVKDQAEEKKVVASDNVSKLDKATADQNRETISDSKENKSEAIDELIASLAESRKKDIKKDFAVEGSADGNDIYKFFINIVEGDTAYGCLTYYDSANKVILRKNFKISSEGIDYNYAPKAEWTKGDVNCKTAIFGNGGNYIAAYVDKNISSYIGSNNKFKGVDVSILMRDNIDLNNNIDARNVALAELEEINKVIVKKEAELQAATEKVEEALNKYKDAVAIYEKVASAEAEIEKSNVEKAKLEYVKAEVEAWRKQQALNQIKEVSDNVSKTDKKKDTVVAQENIEVVVNNIARNLGVEPAEVEELVVQTIIDTEESFAEAKTYDIEAAEIHEQPQEILTIEDNEVPLADFSVDGATPLDLKYFYIIVLACLACMLFITVKKKQRN